MWRAILVAGLAVAANAAVAAELNVYAAGAVQAAMIELKPVFERDSGHRLMLTVDTVGALRDRIAKGETPDLIIVSAAALDTLDKAGRLMAGSRRDVGATGIGLAVPRGAPRPDISTPEKLREALLRAPSLAYADPARGATAGTHFRKVLDELGIAEAVASKATLVPFGGDGVAAAAEGRVALAVSQASEIVTHHNVDYVGPLPPPLQLATPYGIAAVKPATPASDALVALVTGPAGVAALARVGFTR